jgi:signal transduction histidine kinase
MNNPLRFSAVGVALAYCAASLLVLALFATPLWYAWDNTISNGRIEALDGDARRLETAARVRGLPALAAAIDAMVGDAESSDSGGSDSRGGNRGSGRAGRMMLLTDAAGHPLAGNLPQWPAATGCEPGPHETTLRQHGLPLKVAYVCRQLPGGERLLVGNNINRFDKLERLFIYGLLGCTLTLLCIAVAGSLLTRRALLARIRRIEESTSAIVHGNLSARLATTHGDDEVDALTRTVNRMLDQIEQLIVGVRDVSNAIAHDLRTPLGALRYRLEEIVMTRPPAEQAYADIDAAILDVDQVLAIFNALLRLAEIDSGARRAGFVDMDARAVAAEVVEFYQPLAELKETSLRFQAASPLPLRGDPLLLAQAVGNLVDNALKYTPPGGAIDVVAEAQEDGIAVTVSDNGPGITDAERDKVLQRFYRSDASRGTPGAGLGLSLVDAVARLHGGAVELASGQPGLRARLLLRGGRPSRD